MESQDSLDLCLELVESLSLYDSLIGVNTHLHSRAPNPETGEHRPKYERLDTASVPSSVRSAPPGPEADPLETHRASGDHLPCSNPSCISTILSLEKKVKLLESQNSQLIINTCSMYNTLMKHIESLREEIRKKGETPDNM